MPQSRKRIFIAGFRELVGFSFNDLDIPDPGPASRLRSVLHPENGTEKAEPPYTVGAKARVAEKYILSSRLWSYLQSYAAKQKAAGNGFGFGFVGPEDVSRTMSARYYKDGSEILVKQQFGNPLTPRECARLMGFDSFVNEEADRFVIPVSDTQAYRQFGDSVVVPCVKAIASLMVPWICIPESSEVSSFLAAIG